MGELKPCPFCGGEAQHRRIPAEEGIESAGGEFIECGQCGACTNLVFPLKDDVTLELTERWNRRPAPPDAGEFVLVPRDLLEDLEVRYRDSCNYCHGEGLICAKERTVCRAKDLQNLLAARRGRT